MSATPSLSFVLLHVADIDTSFQYFTEQLGFAPIPEQSGPTFRMFAPAEGGIPFSIITEPDGPAPGSVELIFYTQELEGVREAWTRKGVTASAIETMPFGEVFTVPAPNGEALTVMRPPA